MTAFGTREPGTALALRALPAGVRAADWAELAPRLGAGRSPWLLETALPGGRGGRFDFAGADPYMTLTARGRALDLEVHREVERGLPVGRGRATGDPLAAAAALLPARPGTLPRGLSAFPFLGGAVALVGHGLAATLDDTRFRPRAGAPPLDLLLLYVDRLLARDRATGEAVAIGLGFAGAGADARARAAAAADALAADAARALAGRAGAAGARAGCAARRTGGRVSGSGARSRTARAAPAPVGPLAYGARVRQAKSFVEAGDAYQVCLTHRIDLAGRPDPWRLYAALRRRTPAPFAACVDAGPVAVVSASPERFLRVEPDGCVETRPMKGTRPRGETPEADAKLRAELRDSAKDRAENVMIVDLARNDLGRVCATGSVHVDGLCELEAHPTVFQLVSTVRGRLRPGVGPLEALRAAFPPGSMTGAPKLRALEILDALEPHRRGFYAGALGHLDVRGALDLSVLIRCLFLDASGLWLGVGGGIVADSDPAAEYQETLDKAAALRAAHADLDDADLDDAGREEP